MKLLCVLSLVFFSLQTYAETITLAGSSTIMPIVEDMAPIFAKQGIELKVQGGGSSAGLKSVKMGMAQIGMVSRALSAEEEETYRHLTIARDWVVMIANKGLKQNDITTEEVKDIYTNKGNKRFHVIAKEAGRATKEVFDSYFGFAQQLRSDLIIIGANGQAITSVENDPDALAYVSYSAAIAAVEQGSPIKILTLDGVAGTPENVKSDAYKLSRQLNLVYLDKQKDIFEKCKTVLSSAEAHAVFEQHSVLSGLSNPIASTVELP